MIFIIYVGMVKYAGFRDAGQSVEDMLSALPEPMKAIFGIGNLDLTQVSGYYIVFFLYFALMCGVHAIMQGTTVVSKEERDKTADFLFVKPLKRHQALTSKLIASLMSIICLNLVTWIGSIVIVELFNDGDPINDLIMELMVALLFVQLIYFAIGFLLGMLASSTKKATGYGAATLLGTFILSVVIDLYSKLDFLKYFTPFKYYDGKAIFMRGIDIKYIILSIVIILISIGLSYRLYQKKDLHV
jgi:ABC-2 type transport system permease protein